jgi:hypothetical protein
MDTERKIKVGGNVDSWCGKCKMMLAHTIEAMVGDKPARVHCNTCKSQHIYKANPPSTTTRPARARAAGKSGDAEPPTPKTRATKYQTLLKGKDMAGARSYSSSETYEAGDVLQHPTFGTGVATAVKEGSKVEVLFETGSKVLIHGR